ncbi:hypothetical protein [Rhodococcoides fascians]|uniref:hypothetical protein n=1 Tax=Rhodococcoides fascians TaxID=1828 RepID=UPI0012D31EE5|nr:hypothetical protein [Rhodococcus fascians]
MSRANAVHICGGDTRPGSRDKCRNTLHDWPLPSGYVDASEMAMSRLAQGWANIQCDECNIYGWRQGQMRGLAAESVRVSAAAEREKP